MATTTTVSDFVPAAPGGSFGGTYALDPAAIARFRRDGHVVLRGVADPSDIETVRPAIAAQSDWRRRRLPAMEARSAYEKAFVQNVNLWTRDEVVARFTLAARFGRIAAELMAVDGVRLYHDQSLFKEPGGGHTPWHQDQAFWPFDGAKLVTMWMALVDADDELGTMRFASGSHRLGYLGPPDVTAASEPKLAGLIREQGFEVSHPAAMRAGDATFHDGWVLHGAPANRSARAREAMVVIYVEHDAVISEPDSAARRFDLQAWLPGQKPGDRVGSERNPVVWHRQTSCTQVEEASRANVHDGVRPRGSGPGRR